MLLVLWFVIAVAFGFMGASVARNKGKEPAAWGLICFLIPISIVVLLASNGSSRSGTASSADVDIKWDALLRYDPEIRSAANQLAAYGPDALAAFQRIFSTVENKAAIPEIVSDIITAAKASQLTSLLAPPGFKRVGEHAGVEIYGNGRQFWLNGQIFTSKETALIYANVLSKRASRESK